jgi:hypothetical protein
LPTAHQRTTRRSGRIRRGLRWLLALVDDALPMPPDQRSRRDAVPLGSDEVSRRQRLRLKLHLLEKRGKGGYR